MIKHSPKDLDDLAGLNPIKKSLKQIDFNQLVKPIMFYGTRGCGKTSLANIVASKFCSTPENIRTINCGDYRKLDDMRALIEDLHRSSIFGDKKVVILDECHRLTKKDSQPPWLVELSEENLKDNLLIIACTTEIQDLLDTFIRRFVVYTVKPLTDIQSNKFIDKICQENNIQLSRIAKSLLLEKCDGVPALMLDGIRKIQGIESEDDIAYLLEELSIEEDESLFEFFKLIRAMTSWKQIQINLKKLLKTNTPETIKNGLLNLIAGRLLSDYFDATSSEGKKLIKLYDALNTNSYLEKTNLVMGLYKSYGG